jgi:hypothetical protein
MPAPEYGLRFLGGSQPAVDIPGTSLPTGKGRKGATPSDRASGSPRGHTPRHEAAPVPDLSPDREIEAQIDQDREKAGERDLLNQGP